MSRASGEKALARFSSPRFDKYFGAVAFSVKKSNAKVSVTFL